jgi:plastocyanin
VSAAFADGSVEMTEPSPTDINSWGFTPPDITIAAGQTVTWTNSGSQAHTATATNGAFDTGLVEPGASKTLTLADAGTYAYQCTPHPWMKGSLTVLAAAAQPAVAQPAAQPAVTAPSPSAAAQPAAPAAVPAAAAGRRATRHWRHDDRSPRRRNPARARRTAVGCRRQRPRRRRLPPPPAQIGPEIDPGEASWHKGCTQRVLRRPQTHPSPDRRG